VTGFGALISVCLLCCHSNNLCLPFPAYTFHTEYSHEKLITLQVHCIVNISLHFIPYSPHQKYF
jgi:hypothetical protein